MKQVDQPGLFDASPHGAEFEQTLLFALGEFQSRGFRLAGRALPLDRLLGAVRRAAERYDIPGPSDDEIALGLRELGAEVLRVPEFVAKHPYRVRVDAQLAKRASDLFRDSGDEREINVGKVNDGS